LGIGREKGWEKCRGGAREKTDRKENTNGGERKGNREGVWDLAPPKLE